MGYQIAGSYLTCPHSQLRSKIILSDLTVNVVFILIIGKHNTISRNLISKNGSKGIETKNNGNKELTPPLILSATSAEVTGTTIPGYYVEVFADDEDEGRFYLGSDIADGIGNFVVALF